MKEILDKICNTVADQKEKWTGEIQAYQQRLLDWSSELQMS